MVFLIDSAGCFYGFICPLTSLANSVKFPILFIFKEKTMGPELIMDMWGNTSRQIPRATFEDLVEMLATEIAKISDKLSEDELYRIIAIGALFYQRGFKETGGFSTEDLLIKTLYEGGRA
ncbi:hypothetical protein QN379_08115 [Glaciimonas sp. Gout2]|uniref:hypothetical protein n=2 Tax=Glaciimonas TaxID=1229970 RepID=UPI002AB41F37|nr:MULTISPECIES: hypothetical protein [unclassified Glaciimonas]MDY7549071.1 hypothetical protein [Glaciimonas sp. CA11.2]MEB0013136.1 hypothetical protein [Glaciimonas sp. Cout2]MEB0081981.1 hypothetical protein [Glaciimonas sp. Gout2]